MRAEQKSSALPLEDLAEVSSHPWRPSSSLASASLWPCPQPFQALFCTSVSVSLRFSLTVLGRLGGQGLQGAIQSSRSCHWQVPGPPVMVGTPNSGNSCCPVLQGREKDHALCLLSTHNGNGTPWVCCGFSAVPSELLSFLSYLLWTALKAHLPPSLCS